MTTAEGRTIHLLPDSRINASVSCEPQTRLYRLNRGEFDAPAQLWEGFDLIAGSQRFGYGGSSLITDQLILDSGVQPFGFVPDATPGPRGLWLAAAKMTDTLFIAPTETPEGLRPQLVGAGMQRVTSIRAAALSATYILVNKAALELDIDPEEFDVIEPRLYRNAQGNAVPLLQIADHLINGAGFSERLATTRPDGSSMISAIIDSVIKDHSGYPLRDFWRSDDAVNHPKECDQACYRCLQRYSNQSYHGLLDWRLGLGFIEILRDKNWTCGLDGAFEGPALSDWQDLAMKYARDITVFSLDGEIRPVSGLIAFRFDKTKPHWAVIVHPLWDISNLPGIVNDVWDELSEPGARIEPVDTFELGRRLIATREKLLYNWSQ